MSSREQGYQTLLSEAGDVLQSKFTEYANNRSTLKFSCSDCQDTFITTSFLWRKSADGKRCIKCKHRLKVNSTDARAEFIRRCESTHGKYYSYDKLPAVFKQSDQITIICPKHGDFTTTGDMHSQGSGCNHCKIDKVSQANRSTMTEFVIKANGVHDFKYSYSGSYINAKTAITISCPKHGEFQQTPDVHLRGSGCPDCNSTSQAVRSIVAVLKDLNVPFCREKSFPTCVGVSGRLLRFDIHLPEHNILIEYDGPHHFGPVAFSSSSDAESAFDRQVQNDRIKDNFAEQHNINLIRIPHTIKHADAYVRKLLTNELTPERYFYSYSMLENDVKSITSYIKSFGYDKFAVYGIARGGVLFSIPVTYHFDGIAEYGVVTFQRYDGNDKKVRFDIEHETKGIPIFVIDDLISSGITMKKTVAALTQRHRKSKIHPIVIFGEENEDGVFFVREHPKQWIVFPYEV